MIDMILEQIKNPDFFNNSEQNMIYFLQNNLNSFDQVTLNKMAKESFSSTSSVLRFCKKLGFDGFKDFKLQLIREASISGQDLNFNLPFSPDDSVEDIGLHLSEILTNGIKKCLRHFNSPAPHSEGTEKVDYTVYIWYNVSIKYRRCFYDRTTAEIDAKSIHGNI